MNRRTTDLIAAMLEAEQAIVDRIKVRDLAESFVASTPDLAEIVSRVLGMVALCLSDKDVRLPEVTLSIARRKDTITVTIAPRSPRARRVTFHINDVSQWLLCTSKL
jgi:hypothetical protein